MDARSNYWYWSNKVFCILVIWFSGLATQGYSAATVTGPVLPNTPSTGANTFTQFDAIGYEQAEYFIEGAASAYTTLAPLSADGKWDAIKSSESLAPFKTRLLVFRPVNTNDFNGTVYVEWMNVSGGQDGTPVWSQAHNQIIREGAIYVGVSAQAVGVQSLVAGISQGQLERYASLHHPGDSFSYDIFSQVGQAIIDYADLILGAGVVPKRLVANGSSQSTHRLVTYINAIQPLYNIYNGFLILHNISPMGSELSQAPEAVIPVPHSDIRNDILSPVMVLNTETDVVFSALLNRQPDSETFRLWEIAGTGHFDIYGFITSPLDIDDGSAGLAGIEYMLNPISDPLSGIECQLPINAGPFHYVANAAIQSMEQWLQHGEPPPNADRLQTVMRAGQPDEAAAIAGRLKTTTPPERSGAYALDALGNALGGVRTPYVDTPIAALGHGLNAAAPDAPPFSAFCFIFGKTTPFSQAQLKALYKNHGEFVSKWSQSTQAAFKAGFIVKEDVDELKNAAEASSIGQ